MDIEKCKALVSAIETGSITAAAAELSFTPSGISRSIVALEEQLGFSLLVRGRNGVQPTKECEQILPDIRSLINMEERLLQSAALICGVETGSLLIGSAYPSFNQMLAQIIVEFRKEHPGVEISLIEGTSSELCAMLEAHKLDLCIVSKRDNIPDFMPIVKDHICAWVSVDHPAASGKVYDITRLKEEKYIELYPGLETDNSICLRKFGITPEVCASTSDIFAAYSMVEAGLGVTLINNILASRWEGSVVALPLNVKFDINIGLAAPDKQERSPAAEAFLIYLHEAGIGATGKRIPG